MKKSEIREMIREEIELTNEAAPKMKSTTKSQESEWVSKSILIYKSEFKSAGAWMSFVKRATKYTNTDVKSLKIMKPTKIMVVFDK